MQLPMTPGKRRNAHQSSIVRGLVPSYRTVGQHPRIDAVRFPDLCQLLPRLLESQLLSECFCFVTLVDLDRSQLVYFLVKPLLADLERGKTGVPACLALPSPGFDILDHEDTHWKDLAEKGGQVQFPLPACLGGGRQLLLALFAVLARLAARGLAIAAGAAHARAVFLRFLDAVPGLGLDIEVGVGCRGHHDALAFGTRIDAHRDGLLLARGWLDIEAHAEHAPFPEAGGFPTSDPAPCPRGGRGHQWGAFLIDHRDTDLRHVR